MQTPECPAIWLIGTISIAVKSSTIFTLGIQFERRSFTKTTKGIGPNLVPCGILPLRCSDADDDDSKRKHRDQPCYKQQLT